MHPQSIAQSVRAAVSQMPSREPFFVSSFDGLGSRASIVQTLMRLTREGAVFRVARGVYVRAEKSRFGLEAMPSAESVARAVVRKEGAVLGVHGSDAVRRFGFSTQTPTQPVFSTTGTSRTIRLGRLNIRLEHVAPQKLALGNSPAGQALSALWYLGKKQVSVQTFVQLKEKLDPLDPLDFVELVQARSTMPAWMESVLMDFEHGTKMSEIAVRKPNA